MPELLSTQLTASIDQDTRELVIDATNATVVESGQNYRVRLENRFGQVVTDNFEVQVSLTPPLQAPNLSASNMVLERGTGEQTQLIGNSGGAVENWEVYGAVLVNGAGLPDIIWKAGGSETFDVSGWFAGGDKGTWALINAPTGVTISSSGVLTNSGSSTAGGPTTITITHTAPHSGTVTQQTMGLTINAASILSYKPGDVIDSFTGSGPLNAYRDTSNVWQPGTTNVPRDVHYEWDGSQMVRTLLVEQTGKQMLLNPASPTTESVTLVAGVRYTVWMQGSGSVDVSGATAGSYGTVTENPNNATVLGTEGTHWLLVEPSITESVTFTLNGSVVRLNCIDMATSNSTSWHPKSMNFAAGGNSNASDIVYWNIPTTPEESTLYLRYIHFGAGTYGSGRLFTIGYGNPQFYLKIQTTRFMISHHNGTQEVDQVLNISALDPDFSGSVGPTNFDPLIGHIMEIRAVLKATGQVQLGGSLDGAAEKVSAVSGTPSGGLAPAWPEGRLYLPALGGSVIAGAYTNIEYLPGELSMAECRQAAGVS